MEGERIWYNRGNEDKYNIPVRWYPYAQHADSGLSLPNPPYTPELCHGALSIAETILFTQTDRQTITLYSRL